MQYVSDRVVHDADSHIFEPPGFYEPYADPEIRLVIADLERTEKDNVKQFVADVTAAQRDPELRAKDEDEVLLRKGFAGIGAFLAEDRPKALDLLGFQSQLVFTTSFLGPLLRFERGEDPNVAYGVATAHNRGMADFCSADARLLPVSYVPLMDIERAAVAAQEAIEAHDAAALMISSLPPRTHSPSHVGLDALWARAQEAGVPIVFHVGGGKPMDPVYKENGLPPVKDFTGGDGNFTSVSFMAIPDAPMQTISTMIIDGALERFPALKIGVIEQGASWVPGWMRSMDSARDAFSKNEERLHKLSMLPSEYVRRQVRVTPYPHEPAGWVVQNTGPEVCLFSSDYPHTEGGRNPLKRFEASLAGCTEAEKSAFYCGNFEDLMGPVLDRVRSVRVSGP